MIYANRNFQKFVGGWHQCRIDDFVYLCRSSGCHALLRTSCLFHPDKRTSQSVGINWGTRYEG